MAVVATVARVGGRGGGPSSQPRAGLLLPLLAVAFFLAVTDPQTQDQHWLFATMTAAFGFCLLCCLFSLVGIRFNGAWAILPPAVLGILLNLALGLLALAFWALSYGPRSP